MKRLRGFLVTIIILLCSVTSNAYDFKKDGVCYDITSEENLTVGVARNFSMNYVNGNIVINDGGYSGEITIPSTVRYNNKIYTVTSIESYAFYNSPELTEVSIPSTVTTVESEAFPDCSALKKITLGNSITNIGYRAFRNCTALIDITLPCTVISMGFAAFENCTSLTDIIIPNSVTNIEYATFGGCSSLKNVVVGNSVTSIGNAAFSGCISLTNITIGDSVATIGEQAFYNCSALAEVCLPNSVRSIEKEAFYGCSSLANVTIGHSVTDIGTYAFRNCSALTSIVIPDSTINLGEASFVGCELLADVVIGNSVKCIEKETFSGCSALTTVVIGNGVKSIGERAFRNCSALKSVIIPDSVILISAEAFYGCSALDTVVIPHSVTEISNSSFENCTGELFLNCNIPDIDYVSWFGNSLFEKVVIGDSVTTIGNSAFLDCNSVNSFTMGKNVRSIGVRAFEGCSGINSISIPKGVDTIPNMAFLGCTGLKNIIIEDGNIPLFLGANDYSYPGKGLFSDCFLESIYIGRELDYNSSEYYGYSPFYGMDSLRTVTIGSGVKSLGENIFSSCGIDSLTVKAFSPPVACSFDTSIYENTILKVPYGTLEHYKSADVWMNFNNIQEFGDFHILTCIIDNCIYYIDSIAAGVPIRLNPPTKEGYTFSGWSEIPETMPAEDVTVEGYFIVNSYTLLYVVDGEEYKKIEVEYGSPIVAEPVPIKEGCLFSGWSEIPESMPAHDVLVTGSFNINGLDNITTDTKVDVYNLQGIKVLEQVLSKNLKNILPKGVYIVNGRRVVVR